MQRTGIFQEILNAFSAALQPGVESLHQYLLFYWQFFFFAAFIWSVYQFAVKGAPLTSLLDTAMRGSLVYWALDWWPTLVQWTQITFSELGLIAGGAGGRWTAVNLLDPASYLNKGIDLAVLLYDRTMASWSLWSVPLGLIMGVLYCIYMAAFITMALSFFCWEIETMVASVMSLLLLPCLANRHTAWVAAGTIGFLVNMGFKFGVSAFLLSLTMPLLDRLMITSPVTMQSALISAGGAWAHTLLLFRINKLASSVLSGLPQLRFSDVFSHAIMTGATAIGLGSGAMAAGGAAGAVLAGGSRAGMMAGAGGRAALSALSQGASPGAALQAGRAGAQSMAGSTLGSRMGSFVGGSGQVAKSNAARSIRSFANVGSYVGGGDHAPNIGARR